MPFAAILREVDQLHSVSTRLEGLAEQHAPISEALLTIAGNVRNTATVLAVLIVAKGDLSTAGNMPKSLAATPRNRDDHVKRSKPQ
ncbi:MAG: hypothetical protein WBV55_23360 [Candidatus Sulfotelmatobacter sp.]